MGRARRGAVHPALRVFGGPQADLRLHVYHYPHEQLRRRRRRVQHDPQPPAGAGAERHEAYLHRGRRGHERRQSYHVRLRYGQGQSLQPRHDPQMLDLPVGRLQRRRATGTGYPAGGVGQDADGGLHAQDRAVSHGDLPHDGGHDLYDRPRGHRQGLCGRIDRGRGADQHRRQRGRAQPVRARQAVSPRSGHVCPGQHSYGRFRGSGPG